jgi:UDP-N-acetylmuramoylalanine--D-glutamate ligase
MAAAGNMIGQAHARDLDGLSLVLGLGASGVSAARFVRAHGGSLRILDSRASPPGLEAVASLGAEVVTESLDPRWLDGVRRVILSPGLSIDLGICAAARERGIEIVNDIEIFARYCSVPVLAVTGSNGKSTVASLVAAMLQAAGVRAPAGGNLGPPALDLLDRPADAYVLEISSFQMEAADSLAPLAAAVLNVSADHLDRHPDLESYAALKEKLLRGARTAIVNADDPVVRAMGQRHSNAIEFSVQSTLERGYSLVETAGGSAIAIDGQAVLPVAEMAMHGRHNVANALAALALAKALRAADDVYIGALRTFTGLAHRCEALGSIDGVAFINDSKATNVGATAAALAGLPGPLVLLAGGLGKDADFSALREIARGKVRAAVLIGRSADEIAAALEDVCAVYRAASMDEAVAIAYAQARPGDTVILSPACASQDMFENYEARGRAFRDAVEGLPS